MRNTIGIVAATVLILLCLVSAPVGAEDEMRVPMGEITLEPLTTEAKRSAVTFPHAVHFDYSCRQCHHTWEKEEPISGCSATGCHDLAEAPKDKEGRPVKDATMQIRYYKNAYHQMCIGCHLQIEKDNKALQASRMSSDKKMAPTGPTGCIQCHPKE